MKSESGVKLKVIKGLNQHQRSHAHERSQKLFKAMIIIILFVMIALLASPLSLPATSKQSRAGVPGETDWTLLSDEKMNNSDDIASFDFSVGWENYKGNFRFGSYVTKVNKNTASLFQLTYYLTNKDTNTDYSYLYKYGSCSYVNLFEHQKDNSSTSEIKIASVEAVYVRENYPAAGLTSVKAVGKNENYEVELMLIPNQYGTVAFETKITPITEEPINRNFLWRLDTEMSYRNDSGSTANDAVPVYSMGKDRGLYIKDSTMALIAAFPHTSDSLYGPDSYQALKFSELNDAFGGCSGNFSGSGNIDSGKDEQLLAANTDSSVLFVWRNRTFSKAEPMIMRYQVGLASANEQAAAPEFALNQTEQTISEQSNITISGSWFDRDSDEVVLWSKLSGQSTAISLGKLSGALMTSNIFEYTLSKETLVELGVSPGNNTIEFYVVDEDEKSSNIVNFDAKVKANPSISIDNGGGGGDLLIVKVEDGTPLVINATTNHVSKEHYNYFIKLESKEPINVGEYVSVNDSGLLTIVVPYGKLVDYVDAEDGAFVVGIYIEDTDTGIRSNVDAFILDLVKLEENPTLFAVRGEATIAHGKGTYVDLVWFDNQEDGVVVIIEDLESGNTLSTGRFVGEIKTDNAAKVPLTRTMISELVGDNFVGTAGLSIVVVDDSGNYSNTVAFSLTINKKPEISLGNSGNAGSNKPIVVSENSGFVVDGYLGVQSGTDYGFYIKVEGKNPLNVSEYVIVGKDGKFKLDIPQNVLLAYVGSDGGDVKIEFYAVDEKTDEQSQPLNIVVSFDGGGKVPDTTTVYDPEGVIDTGQGGSHYVFLSSFFILVFVLTVISYRLKKRQCHYNLEQ